MSSKLEGAPISPPPPYTEVLIASKSFDHQDRGLGINEPNLYTPYTVTLPITDVTKYSHSTFTKCPKCNTLGLTRIEKAFSTCQVLTGIVLILTGYLVIVGILVLIFAMDYDHYCAKCNCKIGRKKTFGC